MQVFELAMEILSEGEFEKVPALISILLSYAIVAGSFTLKVPQILKIMRSGSARGVSLSALEMEVLGFAITVLYNFGLGYELATYAENVVILLQVIILVVLVASYKKRFNTKLIVGGILFFAWVGATITNAHPILPDVTLFLMTFVNIPLSAASRIPQIWSNFKSKDVGVLAVEGFILAWGGNVARIFTTLTGTADTVLLAGYGINCALNFIIIVQCLMYGDGGTKKKN